MAVVWVLVVRSTVMEPAGSSETFVNFYQTRRLNNTEDSLLHAGLLVCNRQEDANLCVIFKGLSLPTCLNVKVKNVCEMLCCLLRVFQWTQRASQQMQTGV
jgi:hypothetical protein